MKTLLILLLVLSAASASAQAPASAATVLAAAEQAVVDSEKALEAAAPVAYKAFLSAVRARNQARELVAAERVKATKPETGSK